MPESPERRSLTFTTVEQGVEEVSRLASQDVTTTGSFNFAQIVDHLAHAFDISSGHVQPPPVPWLMRVVMPLMAKGIANKPMKPGIKLPRKAQEFFWEKNSQESATALAHFQQAYERYRDTDPLPRHPLFGDMPRSQNEQIQCRHMELHLSFVHPVEA